MLFENKISFVDACRKALRRLHFIYNNELMTNNLLDLMNRIWHLCSDEDYVVFCEQNSIELSTTKFLKDLENVECFDHLRDILSNYSTYLSDPRFDGHFGKLDFLIYKHGVYKIFDEERKLVYIGKSENMGDRLIGSIRSRKGRFFSYALTNSRSDTNVYESYYISKYKPSYNREGNYDDELSVSLPELHFSGLFDIKDFI